MPDIPSPGPGLRLSALKDALNSIGFSLQVEEKRLGVLQISITGYSVQTNPDDRQMAFFAGGNRETFLRVTSATALIGELSTSGQSATEKKPPMRCSSTSPKQATLQTARGR
jgi:hypothetical protein